jgi:hypothetical protein
MSKDKPKTARQPATKFPKLQKKLQQQKLEVKKPWQNSSLGS